MEQHTPCSPSFGTARRGARSAVDEERAVGIDCHWYRAQAMGRRGAHDRPGTRVELRAVTGTHDEVGSGGITDGAPGMRADGVVGDEAALGELEDQARVTSLRVRETRSPSNGHLAGLANRGPRRSRCGWS
jgi:hypothetical protein